MYLMWIYKPTSMREWCELMTDVQDIVLQLILFSLPEIMNNKQSK